MVPELGVLADDLTGALDSAAPFATRCSPVTVVSLGPKPKKCEKFAIDMESRDLAQDAAMDKMTSLLPELGTCRVAFKKIDSLMRGCTFAELRACCESKLFGTVVIAPAFPQQGRITKGGRQFAVDARGAWNHAGGVIAEELGNGRARTRLVARHGELEGGGVAICDAESYGDLQRIVSARAQLDGPVLWCGSAGLARELSKNQDAIFRPKGQRRLAIVGSRHPETLAQVDYFRTLHPEAVTMIRTASDVVAAIKHIDFNLHRRGLALAQLAPEIEDSGRACHLHHLFFEKLKGLPLPDLVTVAGGDTLYRLTQTMQMTELSVVGEWTPGVAVSIPRDGHWAGIFIVSKSGAFGRSDFLRSLLDAAKWTE